MFLIKNLFRKTPSLKKVQKKGLEGIINYRKRKFKKAVKSFERYFRMKTKGRFPDLDKDDFIMLYNLGNAKQYSGDYCGAILIYENALKENLTWGTLYLMKSVCFYKLGNIEESKIQWKIARKFGDEIAQKEFEKGIIQF